MSVDLIVFDLDGTLIDSASQIARILNSMRSSRGLEPLAVQSYRALVSHGADYLIETSLELEREDEVSHNLRCFRNQLLEKPVGREILFPGVVESLQFIKRRMIKVAICSNKPGNLCRKILRDLKIEGDFSAVVGGGDASENKPSPIPLQLAIAESQASASSTVFVGDSSIDQMTAKNSKVRFAFFTAGYDDGVVADDALWVSSSIYELTKNILQPQGGMN